MAACPEKRSVLCRPGRCHYLREFARALAIAAARAPTEDDILMFSRHAAGALEVERSLHGSFSASSG